MNSEGTLSVLFRLVAGVMLILAIGIHPSSFYSLLRWVVAASSLYSGWIMSQLKKSNWAWALFIIGILFNPIYPVYLDRTTWQMIDVIVAVFFFISLSVDKQYEK